MKSFLHLGLLLPFCLSSCGIGGNSESQYKTYDSFKKREEHLAKYLPENSTGIHHYAVLDFDTNYHFIEATAQLGSLENFVESNNNFNSQHRYSKVSYSQDRFDNLYHKKPDWWNQKDISEFEENELLILSEDKNYGKGCWLFYDSDMQRIRIFTWAQQWLSEENVIKTLDLKS